jgi:signal transduction histidine kinase
MNIKPLKRIAVIIPVIFWILFILIRLSIVGPIFSWSIELFFLILFSIGSILFSRWVFDIVEQRQIEAHRRTEQLAALNEATMALSKELELGKVLQKVVDLARELVNARYGALGVLGPSGTYLDQFITSGISAKDRSRIIHPPRGRGLLGEVINQGNPIRLVDIQADDRSVDLPDAHPPMWSFLGVPIKSKGKIYGNLYLTDKLAGTEADEGKVVGFTEEDEQLLVMFATQAAIAIENAQLYRQIQQLAVLEERERFGMDLHDGTIQSIYAIGLMLEDTLHRLETSSGDVSSRIQRAIHDLNDVISDIRNYILDLRPQRFQGRNLNRGLEEIAREIRANSFLNVDIDIDGVDVSRLSAEQTVEILHIAQEALTNVRKHARATKVDIEIASDGGFIELAITDDGVGIDLKNASQHKGNGLRNMQERAASLRGDFHIQPVGPSGTRVHLRVPIVDG